MPSDPATFPIGLSVADARSLIEEIAASHRMPIESVKLRDALDRILAIDIDAPRDIPGFVNSAMDGFAVRARDLPDANTKSFRLRGEILAGSSEPLVVGADECVRITTGAALPNGADTVVMKENTRTQGDCIMIAAGTAAGANVRAADDDFHAHDRGLSRGARLNPARIAVLAAFGMAEVATAQRPDAVLLTTGNELVAPGKPLSFGQIHDSNRYSLGGLLQQHGATLRRHERIADNPELLRDALLRAGDDADIVVTSGGVSVGEADFMPQLIAQIGEVVFWKVRMKPGMPMLFGRIGRALVFALPGNPVSGFATFLALVKPAIDAMCSATPSAQSLFARLTATIHKRHSRAEFQRARLSSDATGTLLATPNRAQGSGMLHSIVDADALIVLPESVHDFAAGDVVEVMPLPGWPR
ncbi:MAG TPA: gephyrin-like molybdotransferase Glp [Rudaea sp.]|nr:gephyrin-like molybdotransferase Glp [Rudaea sp.]